MSSAFGTSEMMELQNPETKNDSQLTSAIFHISGLGYPSHRSLSEDILNFADSAGLHSLTIARRLQG